MRSAIGADIKQDVADRIRSVRKRHRLTQARVAERLGIAEQNYRRIESGGQNLTLETIARIASVLGVSTWELLVPPDAPS